MAQDVRMGAGFELLVGTNYEAASENTLVITMHMLVGIFSDL